MGGQAEVVEEGLQVNPQGLVVAVDLGPGWHLMVEKPVAGPGRWLNNPLLHAALTRRNIESLARLTALAERRTDPVE